MDWIEGFLKKYKRLGIFDNIWEKIPPYPGYQPPTKRYRQITMWNGKEMRGVTRVILACFTAALRQTKDAPCLPAAAQTDSKIAIRCVRAITDFCLVAQYRSHTPQTLRYMTEYLQQFHQSVHIFAEFRAGKADREEAAKVAKELGEGQARQATINQYFQLTSTQRAKRNAEDRDERQQAVHSILQQATFNFPKIHLLSHYSSQIVDFGTLPQYSTEITEALHKPLKDAYRRSNRVDVAEQILDTISRDYAIRIRELNLRAWSREVQLPVEVLEILGIVSESAVPSKATRGPIKVRQRLGGKQSADILGGTPLSSLATELGIPSLVERFRKYLMLNSSYTKSPPSSEEVSCYRAHYYNTLSVPVMQFQEDGEVIHHLRWTGKKGFRQRGEARADWVWVRQRERGPVELQFGQLDGKMVGRLEGLFSVQEATDKVHEVALVALLRLRGPAKPCGEEGMIRVEYREGREMMHIVRIGDIEGMAHLIPLEAGRVWLVNNRIDLTTWNELYT